MRTFTLLSFCLFLSVGSNAQQNHLFKKHASKRSFKQSPLNKAAVKYLPQLTMDFYWSNDSWNLSDSVVTTYNTKGLLSSEEKTYLSGAQFKTDNVYDSIGRLTGYTVLTRDDKFFPWDSVSKSYGIYDLNGNETEWVEYSFEDSIGWTISYGYKTTYTYNTSKLPISLESEYYDKDADAYLKENKMIFDYDGAGKITAFTSMIWNETLGSYENESRTAEIIWYKWNASNIEESLMLSANDYEWSGTTYELSSRYSTTYDSHDNETGYKEESLIDGIWVQDYAYQYLFTYNTDGAMTEGIEQAWKNADSTWQNNFRYEYSNFLVYSDTIGNTGVSDIAGSPSTLTIYPNPFENQTVISLTESKGTAQFMLYNLTGKNVRTIEFVGGKTILEKGDLPAGMYFYIVTNDQKIKSSGKLMIK